MMANPKILAHDTMTGEVIERSMTDDEFEQHKKDQAQAQQALADLKAKKLQRIALLERLGLTEDEMSVLLS